MKYLLFFFVATVVISCSDDETDNASEIQTTVPEIMENTIPEPEIVDTLSKPGETVDYHPNGAVKMRGRLNENGEREGLWLSYYDNGIKWSEAYYVDGILDGHSITFFPNGKVRYIGEYKNGDKMGSWKFYDESGNLVKEENF